MSIITRNWKLLAALAGYGVVREVIARQRSIEVAGKVVMITGGSRGLGLVLAETFAQEKARLVLCSRDEQELARAQNQLTAQGAEVFTIVCDVSDPVQAQQAVQQASSHFGPVDILINNAGIISAGPWQTLTRQDFEHAMDIMFWGNYNMTTAVLPAMQERKSGRIINISSIGGKVSVPHLLPYASAKFAQVGFSEGLRAELIKDGIFVTTVIPGLMRTGSQVNTVIKGASHRTEYTLFSLMDTLPGISISAQQAAKHILKATKRGQAELVISIPAQILTIVHGILPELVIGIFGLSNRFLPTGKDKGTTAYSGRESETPISSSFVTKLGQEAAQNNNEISSRANDV